MTHTSVDDIRTTSCCGDLARTNGGTMVLRALGLQPEGGCAPVEAALAPPVVQRLQAEGIEDGTFLEAHVTITRKNGTWHVLDVASVRKIEDPWQREQAKRWHAMQEAETPQDAS